MVGRCNTVRYLRRSHQLFDFARGRRAAQNWALFRQLPAAKSNVEWKKREVKHINYLNPVGILSLLLRTARLKGLYRLLDLSKAGLGMLGLISSLFLAYSLRRLASYMRRMEEAYRCTRRCFLAQWRILQRLLRICTSSVRQRPMSAFRNFFMAIKDEQENCQFCFQSEPLKTMFATPMVTFTVTEQNIFRQGAIPKTMNPLKNCCCATGSFEQWLKKIFLIKANALNFSEFKINCYYSFKTSVFHNLNFF